MFELPIYEMGLFSSVLLIYFASAVVCVLQLVGGVEKCKHWLPPLISLAVVLETVLLIFRAVELRAIPLTGLFESLIVLTIVFGLVYLFASIAVPQVWFCSIMTWVMLVMVLMAGVVATPASEPQSVAATPWAIAHGIAMILGGASVTFAMASAWLYLLGRGKLKRKEVTQVLGRVPNIERLERMNLLGVRASFLFITVGLASGLGLASVLHMGLAAWLTDAKVIWSIGAWLFLAGILASNRMLLLKGRVRACMTIAAFLLVLFAILGVAILGATRHNFSQSGGTAPPATGQVQK